MIIQVVPRLQVLVRNRPVIGHTVLRFDSEIGRMQARCVRHPHDGASANTVEHHGVDRRVLDVYRVVLRKATFVRVYRPGTQRLEPEVKVGRRVLERVLPVALFDADHIEAGLG